MNSQTVYNFAKKVLGSRHKRLISAALRLPIVPRLASRALARLPSVQRRAALLQGFTQLEGQRPRRRLIDAARLRLQHTTEVEAIEVYWLALARGSDLEAASAVLLAPEAERLLADHPDSTNLHLARGLTAYELGHFRPALESFQHVRERDPEAFVATGIGLAGAYAASMLRESRNAMVCLATYYNLVDAERHYSSDAFEQAFLERALERTLQPLLSRLTAHQAAGKNLQRCAVFYLSSTEALGHAILDPYYFVALRREDYDHVFFLGPPRSSYRPASAVCLKIVEDYGEYVEVSDDALLNFSWMSLGTFRFGSVDLVFEHYWGLLREAVHRSRDIDDTFAHNRWHFSFPEALQLQGVRFCEQHGIDLDRPLVVLHVRHASYHGLEKQAFRDADIDNYRPAVEHLLSSGYQVVRIGDSVMPRLGIAQSGYFELPFLSGYKSIIDPFLVSRSSFMIGCQSGPCAYARAFGTPILTINAVLHYTLLPGRMEMACFKRYVRTSEEPVRDLTLAEALDADIERVDSSARFKQANIELRQSSPMEILAAVQDMIAWLANPKLAETEHQTAFRNAVERKMRRCADTGAALDLPIADYVGIALPGYRLSPTVARMRDEAAVNDSQLECGRLMVELNFLQQYQRSTPRDYIERVVSHDKAACAEIAKQWGADYWDGERQYGYGGYTYDGRWLPVAQAMVDHYGLKPGDRILDIGCGKAFLLFEFTQAVAGLEVAGIDISEYAVENAKEEVRGHLRVGQADKLPWADNSFDFVYSINTFHNLRAPDLQASLREMERVGKGKSWLCVESYRNEREKMNLLYWQLTCRSFYDTEEWAWLCRQWGYTGDYGFIFFE